MPGPTDDIPELAAGTEFLGPYRNSGYREPRYLVRRADGQVAQLPEVLHRVARHADGQRNAAQIAARVGNELDLSVTAGQVTSLVDGRLRPAGIVAPSPAAPAPAAGAPASSTSAAPSGPPATPAPPQRGDHLLMLRHRTALVPERVVWRIAGVTAALFRPVVLTTLLLAFVAVDALVVARAGLDGVRAGGQALIDAPVLTLAVLGLVLVAGVLHESGHVGACRYGGAVPGTMGVGIYIVWPAFYSTVTDSYRLPRAGRLRVDLGGVYLNAVVLAGLGGAYLGTGWAWLLAAVLVLHVETAWQFLPSLRLDGYYILADLVGVPDLFSRMGPVLRSVLHPRRPDRRVSELRPWVRRTVSAWVLIVVPFLLGWLVLFVVYAPGLAPGAWESLRTTWAATVRAVHTGAVADATLGSVQMLLLVLPWASGTALVLRWGRRLGRALWGRVRPAPPGRRAAVRTPTTRRWAPVAAAFAAGALVTGLAVGSPASPTSATAEAASRTPTGAASPAALVARLGGPPTLRGRVSAILDADTVVVDVAGTALPVRPVGMTALTPPACSTRATGFARDTLYGQDVTLVPDPTLPSGDPADPVWHAAIVLDSQLSYTDAAIGAGWATAGPGRYRATAAREEATARADGAGAWSRSCGGSATG